MDVFLGTEIQVGAKVPIQYTKSPVSIPRAGVRYWGEDGEGEVTEGPQGGGGGLARGISLEHPIAIAYPLGSYFLLGNVVLCAKRGCALILRKH